jgi:DNA-binding transcriptional regulator GbsR (MarR family)
VLRIFDYVREKAVISVPDVCASLSLSPPTVNNAVKSLQILNIVREVTGRPRDRRYMYDAYVKIMSDDQATPYHQATAERPMRLQD